MNSTKRTLSEFDSPPDEFWMSIILQLLDGGADVSEINPNVMEFIEKIVNSFHNINEQSTELGDRFYYFADTVMNSHLQSKRNMH
jgi:hypothetical protein